MISFKSILNGDTSSNGFVLYEDVEVCCTFSRPLIIIFTMIDCGLCARRLLRVQKLETRYIGI